MHHAPYQPMTQQLLRISQVSDYRLMLFGSLCRTLRYRVTSTTVALTRPFFSRPQLALQARHLCRVLASLTIQNHQLLVVALFQPRDDVRMRCCRGGSCELQLLILSP
jgi:hypothetical protein